MIRGWLFDLYALEDRIILWFKNKKTNKITKKWTPSLHVASTDQYKLQKLSRNPKIIPFIRDSKWVECFENIFDDQKSKILKLTVNNSNNLTRLARKIQELDLFGVYRLHNVDIPSEQIYLYENDLFPLGKYEIKNNKWNALSVIEETNYKLPTFTKINLKINPTNKHSLPKFTDKIKSIQINDVIIQSDSEQQMILDCVKMINDIDPDFIITENGDTWDLPYLAQRANKNKISDRLILGREKNYPLLLVKRPGTSYFSYGQIHYKPTAIKILGRIHIDKSNCFMWEHEHSLEGVFEIARTCRLPLQTAARASIGKCMSSLQFYNAIRRNLLIPWKPTTSEIFKSRMNLLVSDRGGLILEPNIGAHENVAELDFVSLFSNIMLKKNISAETIECKCCPDSGNKVPDLGYHICKRQGIIPQSIKLLLDKREKYTKLIKTITDKDSIKIYKARKAALKWILVTSFGYLGFNNAKFGRIDAHMAVCAFARNLLLQTIRIAEKNKCRVLHGIVDSIWITKKNATRDDYENIKQQIIKKTGFDLSFDIYNWIVFLPSKPNKIVPVPNRYFGVNQDGKLKIRGIEARRHDTPKFFNKCQLEILNLFAKYRTITDIKKVISEAKSIQKKYKERLSEHEVLLSDLAFTNRVTRGTNEHKSNTVQADALNQLKWKGRSIVAGQKIRYIINDYSGRISKRVIPMEIATSNEDYDVKRYSKLLDDCCKSILEPFESGF